MANDDAVQREADDQLRAAGGRGAGAELRDGTEVDEGGPEAVAWWSAHGDQCADNWPSLE